MIEGEGRKFKRYWREQAAVGSQAAVGTEAEWLRRWKNWFDRTIAAPPVAGLRPTASKSIRDWTGGVTVRNTDESMQEMIARCIREGTYKPPRPAA